MAIVHYLTPVHFDFGALRFLRTELDWRGIRTPHLITVRIPRLAAAAARDFSARTNPRPADAGAGRRLDEEAYG
ncbi:MAG: hypothetical protein HY736_07275 [Verrucomicrobia bacterium]|nr:hypothetical protein [Verrucomicrobiota bacterium]